MPESLRKALDGRLDNLAAGAWVRGGGWDIAAFPSPTAAMLDELTDARPAYFGSSDGHSGWANSVALKLAGIDGADDAPEGGRVEVDAAGKPTGLLRESAMEKVVDLMPDYPDAQVDAGFGKAQAEAHRYGVTALIDPSVSEWMLKGYQRADAAGNMTMKVNAAVKIEADAGAAGVGDVLKLKQQYYGPHFEVNAVKLFVDGVIETGTAALLAPYVGSDKSRRSAVHAATAQRHRDGGRQGRFAIACSCDWRPRHSRYARRFRGGANGKWHTRQPPPDHPS